MKQDAGSFTIVFLDVDEVIANLKYNNMLRVFGY